jgi:hypothetical protein
MRKMNKKVMFIVSLIFLFVANISFSYAYWASEILPTQGQGNAQLGIGIWVPSGFVGVTQDGAGDYITLDQIGTSGYPLSGKYMLMSHIDWNNNAFTPIGGASGVFSGEFYGNGFTISNINITTNQTNIGLFARNSGSIVGVGLKDVSINVSSGNDLFAGGLVGENLGVISKSYTTGSLSISVTKSGGTSGLTSNAIGGGLVGLNSGTITNSHSSVTVLVTTSTNISSGGNRLGYANSYAGGLVGRNTVSLGLEFTYAEGEVTASSTATAGGNSQGHATSVSGGLVGESTSSTGIYRSFAAGNVTTQTAGKTSNTNHAGPVSAIGTTIMSYRRNGQVINGVTNGGTLNGATLATQVELRTELFMENNLSWLPNEWIFDSSFYPRIVQTGY